MHSEELLDLVVGQALARIIFTIWRSLYGSYEYLPPTTSLGYSLDASMSDSDDLSDPDGYVVLSCSLRFTVNMM